MLIRTHIVYHKQSAHKKKANSCNGKAVDLSKFFLLITLFAVLLTNTLFANFCLAKSIHKKNNQAETNQQTLKPVGVVPMVEVVFNTNTGLLMLDKNGEEPIKPASLVKMMSMFIVLDSVHLNQIGFDDEIVISHKAALAPPTKLGLPEGSTIKLRDVVFCMAVHSCNDTAIAVAEKIAGSELLFVERMNKKASELKLLNTRFSNATGLPGVVNFSTGRDLISLGIQLLNTYPEAGVIFGVKQYIIQDKIFTNTLKILKEANGPDIAKTGYTREAGFCVFASIPIQPSNPQEKNKAGFYIHNRIFVLLAGFPSQNARDNRLMEIINQSRASN